MKVMCIEENWFGVGKPAEVPKFQEVYTVIKDGECPCGICGKHVYYLSELDNAVAWQAEYFIPLSDINENVIHEDKKQYA